MLILALLFSLAAAWKWMTSDAIKDEAWQRALAQVNQWTAEPLPMDHLKP